MLEFRFGEPEREILRITLILIHHNTCTGAQFLEIKPCKPSVFLESINTEIDIAPGHVGIPALFESLNQSDHVFYMIGCLAGNARTLDMEFVGIGKKGISIELSNLVDAFSSLPRGFYHLVLALIVVPDKVSYVGDVHHMGDRIPRIFQHASENILEDIGAEITYVSKGIDSRTAGIHPDIPVVQRVENLEGPRHRVIELHSHRSPSPCFVFYDKQLPKSTDWTTIHLTNVRETGEKINMSLELEHNKDMRTRTTMKTGGKAEFFAQPVRIPELHELLRWASEEGHQVTIIGGGSNILISDAGIQGLVIDMRLLRRITMRGCLLTVSAGNLLEKAVSSASEAGLSGLEVFSGLPGTIGGALTGNAGCFGHEISEPLAWVEYMDLEGNTHRDAKEELSFSYRESPFKHNEMIILEAAFLLEPAEAHIVTGRAKQYRQQRREMGQYRNPSMGSVFKNPVSLDGKQQLSAGRLIEQAGLLGFAHHKAQVADYHGNYIINPNGEATSQDIYDLVRIIQRRVAQKSQIKLEPEIRFLGNFAEHTAP